MNLLPIPWMKQKLESIYKRKLYGNLHLIYNNLDSKNNHIYAYDLIDLLNNSNITLDDSNPLYIYLPFKVDTFIKNLIVSFKSISKNNTYIVLGGYKEDYLNQNELDLSYHLYVKFPELIGLIDYTYLIDSSKCFEIFTALSDTQRLSINPTSSFTISGSILNYNIKQNTPNNANHLSFVTLMDEYLSNSFVDSYLKGLTNKNNNFNYNF
ncbi:MAG: hypothetical protein RSD47_00065 [Romboutsia sp.]